MKQQSKLSERFQIRSGASWEEQHAYSRALAVGKHIFISGTTAVEGSEIRHPGDFYAQTQFILQKIDQVLKQGGFQSSDVARTRLFITNIDHWQEVSQAHREFFEGINPASTMVEVSRLIDDRLLVEIEVDAVKG